MIPIDGRPFDPSSEHFSFGGYHKITDVKELAKLRAITNLRSASF